MSKYVIKTMSATSKQNLYSDSAALKHIKTCQKKSENKISFFRFIKKYVYYKANAEVEDAIFMSSNFSQLIFSWNDIVFSVSKHQFQKKCKNAPP